MARSVAALALLALLSVASAERSLLAHKPNGGSSLHAVALGSYTVGSTGGITTFGQALTAGAIVQVYVSSNGNASWTYTEGTSSPKAPMNYALLSAQSRTGATSGLSTGGSALAVTGIVGTGVNSVFFPSMKLGIAVGASGGNGTTATPLWPTILTTVDQGLSWQLVTGFSGHTGTPAAVAANLPGYAITVAAGAPTFPDLTSVYCASRTLCFAVGGYLPSSATFTAGGYMGSFGPNQLPYTQAGVSYETNASFPSTYSQASLTVLATPGTGGNTTATQTAGLIATYGAVLVSTNGGTQWTFQPVGSISGLYAVSADSSGRHVYAVGATAGVTVQGSIPSANVSFYTQTPTIIYSGNYGLTWVNQTAPVIPSCYYQLFTVAVLRGTIAYAAGGNPFSQNGIGALSSFGYGTIVATFNGGFTWAQQPIQSYSTSANQSTTNAPFQSGAAIPVINSICFITPQTGVAVGRYVGWAVGENGLILRTLNGVAGGLPIKTVSNAYPTIPVQTLTPWVAMQAAPPVNGNAGFVTSGSTYPASLVYPAPVALLNYPTTNGLYAIVWDNNNVGYIYGQGVILSTHNMGATWQSETPAPVSGYSSLLTAAANVPTTF